MTSHVQCSYLSMVLLFTATATAIYIIYHILYIHNWYIDIILYKIVVVVVVATKKRANFTWLLDYLLFYKFVLQNSIAYAVRTSKIQY